MKETVFLFNFMRVRKIPQKCGGCLRATGRWNFRQCDDWCMVIVYSHLIIQWFWCSKVKRCVNYRFRAVKFLVTSRYGHRFQILVTFFNFMTSFSEIKWFHNFFDDRPSIKNSDINFNYASYGNFHIHMKSFKLKWMFDWPKKDFEPLLPFEPSRWPKWTCPWWKLLINF